MSPKRSDVVRMTEQCGHRTKTTDAPCSNPVAPGSSRCAAGHPVTRLAFIRQAAAVKRAAPPGTIFGFEEIFKGPYVDGVSDAETLIRTGMPRRSAAVLARALGTEEAVRGMVELYEYHAQGAIDAESGEPVGVNAPFPTVQCLSDDYDRETYSECGYEEGVRLAHRDILAKGRTRRYSATMARRLRNRDRRQGQIDRLREHVGTGLQVREPVGVGAAEPPDAAQSGSRSANGRARGNG